jgi:hypothetical protein
VKNLEVFVNEKLNSNDFIQFIILFDNLSPILTRILHFGIHVAIAEWNMQLFCYEYDFFLVFVVTDFNNLQQICSNSLIGSERKSAIKLA